MLEKNMIEVKLTKTMGRGVFATQDIKADITIHLADVIKIEDAELDKCPTMAKYAYAYSKKYSVICLGLGSLFNHSDDPNMYPCFTRVDGRLMLEFVTLKEVKKGEQIFFCYGGDNYQFKHLLK
jgi:uncharacterized protein